MNWRQVFDRLPSSLRESFSKKVEESKLETFIVRCHDCELTQNVKAENQMGAYLKIKEMGWLPFNLSTHPNLVRLIYMCTKCKRNVLG